MKKSKNSSSTHQVHHGMILEKAIRKSGFLIATISNKLNVSRNTLYQKFKLETLPAELFHQVGTIIHYNFANDLPSLGKGDKNIRKDAYLRTILQLEQEYRSMLEQKAKLINQLLDVSLRQDTSEEIKNQINGFIEGGGLNSWGN